jgi:CubicO group peptidase (beta-lactamase class C family)
MRSCRSQQNGTFASVTISRLAAVGEWIVSRLESLLAEHQVPAAAVAVTASDEIFDHAAGVLNKSTGVEATVDSLFQIGSITKLWTATLVQQLADEGQLDLDAPVRNYLPEFTLGDGVAAARLTARHLLSHMGGFGGDVLNDTGRGDDCLEKFVADLAHAPQLFASGQMFSYNNAGYCVLGRLVEALGGKSYGACLREHLFLPLHLRHAAASPYEAVMYRVAHGHIQHEPGQDPQPAPIWGLPRAYSPAGSLLAMRACDLLAFARMHLHAGVGPDGIQVLRPESVAAMQERQVELPALGVMGNAWGLGWEIFDWPGGTVIGHSGDTVGQSAFLCLIRDSDIAIALLTNGGNARALYAGLVGRTLAELGEVELVTSLQPAVAFGSYDASRYVGVYSSEMAETTVTQSTADGKLRIDRRPTPVFAQLGVQPEHVEVVRSTNETFVSVETQKGVHLPYAFVGEGENGHALFLHTGRAEPWNGATAKD